MAKIWPVYEGVRPTVGWPWAHLTLSEAIDLFELKPSDFVSGPQATLRFGAVDRDLTFAGFKHLIVEVEENEAQPPLWKPGRYRSPVKPKEAFRRLKDLFGKVIKEALVEKLGEHNVMRVEWEPTTDSYGEGALKITVVIAPGATQTLRNGVVLDALVRLQERLGEVGEDRVPIVEYATEAELKEDVGP